MVAAHLNHLIGRFSAGCLASGSTAVTRPRERGDAEADGDLVPGVLTLTTLHKVLQNLLMKKCRPRYASPFWETLAEHAPLPAIRMS